MIINSKVLAIEGNNVCIVDKFLESIESSVNVGASTVVDYEFDYDRDVVWILYTDGKIRKISYIENSNKTLTLSLISTITVNFYNSSILYQGKYLALNKENGDLYYLFSPSPPLNFTVYKINANITGNVTLTSGGITISTMDIGSLSVNNFLTYIMFIHNKNIYVMPVGNVYNGNSSLTNLSSLYSLITINLELTSFKLLNPYTSIPINVSSLSSLPGQKKYNIKGIAYNLFLNSYLLQNTASSLFQEILLLNPNYNDAIKLGNNNVHSIHCSMKTGNIYLFSSDNVTCRVFDYKLNQLYSITFPNSANYERVSVNPFSEEIYRIVGNTIYYYDRYGNPLKIGSSLNKSFTYTFVIPGISEVAPHPITPARVVFPSAPNIITSNTPTFVFRVGINPEGWTQQFRVCLDKSLTKISNNDENFVYDRVFDSWSNGENYDSSVVFYYSTDYNPVNNNPNTGTWNILGTGDGLQNGGIVPTNGVSVLPNQNVYVKFTVPSHKALEGIETGQQWYIKIYSYSRK